VIPSNPTALQLERAQIVKTKAEAAKVKAETRKILNETRWYPVAALSAVVVAGVGALAAIMVTAIKVILAH
jgi:aspartate-semialdehyde dehydrogenase